MYWSKSSFRPLMRHLLFLSVCSTTVSKCVLFDIRDGKGQAASLLTLKGDFTLSGATAQDMTELITMFLSGLTERSLFAVTLREAERQGQTLDFSFISLCWHSLMIAWCYFMLIAP